jgi:hypothetical protein
MSGGESGERGGTLQPAKAPQFFSFLFFCGTTTKPLSFLRARQACGLLVVRVLRTIDLEEAAVRTELLRFNEAGSRRLVDPGFRFLMRRPDLKTRKKWTQAFI